ncbi:hypothetical protein [Phytomonospora endophytica]|uniref:Flagellar hook-length control protein FliK n=1 Tax=Phytomonospora endophytica TaxID=714109 RepID=A0A841FWE5_9ACTN|nr:hypothetical protein [Phytomonospora endophytica]MBB6038058.1 hypothetical protein [Phytomonospora endophytica]GIG67478.1 hypothetical protein Pen01_37730 [Phytomonospora endophytica]
MTTLTRRAALLLAALLTAVSFVAADPAARPAQAAGCSGTTGVTVVVDFTAFGGSVERRCALGDPATGIAALQGASFTVTGTSRWGLAFVCRLDGLPTAAAEACVNTPPTSAYWSYWHGTPGSAWTYSTSGASAYNPAPGSVEGWAFGSGAQPTVAP